MRFISLDVWGLSMQEAGDKRKQEKNYLTRSLVKCILVLS